MRLATIALTLITATSFGAAALMVFDGGWSFYVAVVGTCAALALTVAVGLRTEAPASEMGERGSPS